MSDELRQAALRIARSAEAYLREYPGPNDIDYDPEMAQHWTDQSMVARAWLREHPEDDGELIDDECIEAFNDREHELPTQLVLTLSANRDGTAWLCTDETGALAIIKTRGELRRLLAALGVE